MRGCATKRLTSTMPALPRASCRNCRRARCVTALRAVILLGVTLVASVIAYFLSGGWMVHRRRGDASDHVAALPVIWLGAAAATGLVMAGGLAVAISSRARVSDRASDRARSVARCLPRGVRRAFSGIERRSARSAIRVFAPARRRARSAPRAPRDFRTSVRT